MDLYNYKDKYRTRMTEIYNTAKVVWWVAREKHAGEQMGSQQVRSYAKNWVVTMIVWEQLRGSKFTIWPSFNKSIFIKYLLLIR